MKQPTLVVLGLALSLMHAVAQTRDEMSNGLRSDLVWSWRVPSNNPECTLVPASLFIGSDTLGILPSGGAIFSNFNNIINLPSLKVAGPLPDNWYIETQFRVDWSQVPDTSFVQAGLVIFVNADNYFQALVTRNPNTTTVSGSTHREVPGWFEWACVGTQAWQPDNDYIGLRIVHEPNPGGDYGNAIRLYVRHSGTNGQWVQFNGGAETIEAGAFLQFAEGNCPWMRWRNFYNEITELINTDGVRIGVYADRAGATLNVPFYFDYFETNIPVQTRVSGDVDGNNCVDDADLLQVLFNFGASDCVDADLNADGIVDDADLLTVLFNFGTGC
jgi:hypothetical protein